LSAGCGDDRTLRFEGQVFGTSWHITISDPSPGVEPDGLRVGIVAVLDEVDALMSTYRPDSEISRFNTSQPGDWFPAALSTAQVVDEALRTWRLTDGAFDITVGPLVDLWGFGPRAVDDATPTGEAIDRVLADSGSFALQVRLQPPGLFKSAPRRIDLSAIAKGFAVDRIADYLQSLGIANYLVEIGGELRTAGRNPEHRIWRIGIEAPQLIGGTPIEAIAVTGHGVATSGDYRNFRLVAGERVSHTIDPRTGRPIQHSLASVTVVAETAMRADALATGLNVMGADAALQLAEREGFAVYLVERTTEGFRSRHSTGFAPYLE
jgi:thiamine biosynthesis lipoprotein